MQLKGKSVVSGEASGRLLIITESQLTLTNQSVTDLKFETSLAKRAREAADDVLKARYEKAKEALGLAVASIIEGHRCILADPSFTSQVGELILQKGVCAEDAVIMAGEEKQAKLLKLSDSYMSARSSDVYDVTRAWIDAIHNCQTKQGCAGSEHGQSFLNAQNGRKSEDIILYGREITVSDVLNYEFKWLKGIVCEDGSEESHTAVIAATLEVPMLIGLRTLNFEFKSLNNNQNGLPAMIHSETGTLFIEDTTGHSM